MMMKTIRMAVLVIAMLLPGFPALAQASQGGPPMVMDDPFSDQDRNPAIETKRDEVRKKIEAVRIYQLTEELNLDEKTSARMSSLLSSIDQKRHDLQKEQVAGIRSLRDVLRAANPDESKIKQVLAKLEQNRRAIQDMRESELKSLKEILTVEQQARFILFQHDFQRNMRRMIAGARHGNGQGKAGMGQGRSGVQPGGAPPAQ
jgi:Spy/CpxP family protein refolding chaperone